MVYRVVSNDAPRHQQWIVVRDSEPGRPIMVAGPYMDEHVANLHCSALNHEASRRGITKSGNAFLARCFTLWHLAELGWKGQAPELLFGKGLGMTALAVGPRRRLH